MKTANSIKSEYSQLAKYLLFLTSLEKVGQSISSSIGLALMIVDLEVVMRELLGQVYLARTHILCIYELTEIVIIGKHKNFMLATL